MAVNDNGLVLYGSNDKPLTYADYMPADQELVPLSKRDRSLVAFISPWQAQQGITAPESFNLKDLLGVYADGRIRSVHVYAAVRAKASLASQIPITLNSYKGRKKGEAIEEHPILDLLDRVNPQMTCMDFIEAGVTYLELGGTFFIGMENGEIEEDSESVPEELWPLRPDRMFIIPDLNRDNFGSVKRYELRQGVDPSLWITYQPEEMLVVKYFSPLTPYWGLPPLTAARLTLLHDHFQQDFMSKFFQQGMHSGGIITVDGILGDREFQRIQDQWMVEKAGADGHHKPLFLENGVKFLATTMPPKDVEFSQGRNINKHELIGEVFGMSPKAVGDYSDASVLQNADAMERSDWQSALRALQKIINGLNEFLLPRYGDREPVKLFPDTSEIKALQENEAEKAKTFMDLRSSGWPMDRALARIYPDEEPFEAVDPPPTGASEEPKETEDPEPEEPNVQKALERQVKGITQLKKRFIDDVASLEDAFTKAMQPAFREWGSEIIRAAEPELKNVVEALKGKDITPAKAVRTVLKSVDFGETGQDLMVALEPAYQKTAAKAIGFANDALDFVGVAPVSFGLVNPKIETFLEKEALRLVKSVTGTVKEDVRQALIEGMKEGEGINKLTKRLQDIVEGYRGKGQAYRAERVARTEAISAMSKSSQETYKAADIKKNQWLDTGDSRQDELCFQLAAMEPVKIGEEFDNGISAPPAHVNCRCALMPVVTL